MLEHLLETRLDGRDRSSVDSATAAPGDTDLFLDDFLLTHIIFMPIHQLLAELTHSLYPFHTTKYFYFFIYPILFLLFYFPEWGACTNIITSFLISLSLLTISTKLIQVIRDKGRWFMPFWFKSHLFHCVPTCSISHDWFVNIRKYILFYLLYIV